MPTEKQHIRCKTIIEVLGKPKEHVEETIKKYIKDIGEDSDLIILKKEFAEPKQQDKLWSTFVELELVIKGIQRLIDFCFNYMPSSIEIIKPNQFELGSEVIAGLFNDLQARLHNVDMIIKQLKSENDFLKRNMNNIFKNIIMVALAQANLKKEMLSKITGVGEKELEIFLNKLIEEKFIKKEGGVYSLIKNAEAKK